MGMDINTKKLKKNAFRVSKERGIGASRIRVPGGYLDAKILGMVQEIAETYGNGYVHLTTRQGFEIEGIHLEDMEQINQKLQPIIEMLEINQTDPNTGYQLLAQEISVRVLATMSVRLPIIIQRSWQSGLRRKYFPMTCTLRLPVPGAQMTVPRFGCMTLGLLA